MDAVILAAGFGTRVRPGSTVNKAFIEIAGRPAIDWCLDTIDSELVKRVVVVHNRKWSKEFRDWKRSRPDDASFKLELVSDGARSPETAKGAIGSLAIGLQKARIRYEFILLEIDTITSYPLSDFLRWTRDLPALALYRFQTGDDMSRYGKVDFDPDMTIRNFYEKSDVATDYGWLGPAMFPAGTDDQIFEYAEERLAEGEIPNNLGSFIDWLRRRRRVYCWIPRKGTAFDLSTEIGMKRWRKRAANLKRSMNK